MPLIPTKTCSSLSAHVCENRCRYKHTMHVATRDLAHRTRVCVCAGKASRRQSPSENSTTNPPSPTAPHPVSLSTPPAHTATHLLIGTPRSTRYSHMTVASGTTPALPYVLGAPPVTTTTSNDGGRKPRGAPRSPSRRGANSANAASSRARRWGPGRRSAVTGAPRTTRACMCLSLEKSE